jgi:phage shock protein PspC (stress-responsive transcriptional regulator)
MNETTYPFYSYIPSRFAAGAFAVFVYVSLFGWIIQSLHVKCRPVFLFIFIFITHISTFIELVLRGTVSIDVLNTKTLYRVTAPLLSMPPRLLLFANYHYLVELRGKKPRGILDRLIDIVVPIGAITADILLGIANEFSFNPNRFYLSFRLRQVSAGFVLGLAILFYIIWYLAVPSARRSYVLQLLAVSSICVLIEAIYVQLISIPTLFFALNQSEFWFYTGHVIPIAIALITWSIFHPQRLLPPSEQDVLHDETGKELLPPPPIV